MNYTSNLNRPSRPLISKAALEVGDVASPTSRPSQISAPSMSKKTLAKCSEALKALSDDTRLRVVSVLFDGPLNVGQINGFVRLERTLLSHHLKVLRESGIVQRTRDGKKHVYRIHPDLVDRPRELNLGCCVVGFPTECDAEFTETRCESE